MGCAVNGAPSWAAILIEALRDAHRWLDELLSDPRLTLESFATREGKSERSIRMTLSLAFLAPEIVKAAVEGRLPRGFGLKRLVDLPMVWPDQWRTLGLQAPGAGVTNDPPLLVCLPARGDPSIRTRSSVEVRPHISKSGAVDMWQTATLETEICGQRLSAKRVRN
jgi:hypothetical protein